jgi:FkbM family methyltransferase
MSANPMNAKTRNYTFAETAEVFNRLQDDISRDIFISKLRYLFDGGDTERFSQSALYRAEKFPPNIPQLHDKEVVFYGFGNMARELDEKLIKLIEGFHNCKIVAFVDTFISASQGTKHSGIPVVSKIEFLETFKNAIVVISAPTVYLDNYISLIEANFPSEQILEYMPWELIFGKIYFEESIIGHAEDEIFLDCGVLNGETILDFAKYTKFKKVFAFEPDPGSFAKSKQNLEKVGIDNVELVPKGVWSSETELIFNIGISGSSGVKDVSDSVSEYAKTLPSSAPATASVLVTTIDSVVGDERVTLIKMDVEGAEVEALKGAAQTIKQNKPRLAICIYHLPEDIIEIPQYISSLVPEYKFYIRHYTLGIWDSVLYAVYEEN